MKTTHPKMVFLEHKLFRLDSWKLSTNSQENKRSEGKEADLPWCLEETRTARRRLERAKY